MRVARATNRALFIIVVDLIDINKWIADALILVALESLSSSTTQSQHAINSKKKRVEKFRSSITSFSSLKFLFLKKDKN